MSTVKISELVTKAILTTDYFPIADVSGNAYKTTIEKLGVYMQTVGKTEFKGSLGILDTPSSDGFYFASETGTYTNAGGLVVDLANGLSIIVVTSFVTVFEQVIIPINQPTTNVVDKSNDSVAINGEGVYTFVRNKAFVLSEGLNAIEESIHDAFKEVELWGSNVSLSEDYYLARIGYDRTTINDIYFQIKRTDGTLIAFNQFAKTDNDEGIVTYYIQNYLDGYNIKMTIDWSLIPAETDYTSGTLSNMKFDSEKVYMRTVKKEPQLTKNTAYATDESLYIASKFSDTEDVVITFEKCMSNNLMTFKNVKKVSNTDTETITYQFDKVASVDLVDATLADNIGPYKLTGGGWVGGNHGFEGTFSLLTSGYTAGRY